MDSEFVTLGVLGVLAAGLIVYSLMPRKKDDRDIIKRRLWGKRGTDEDATVRARAKDSAREEFVRKAAPMLSKIIMPTSEEEQNNLRYKLASAGYRHQQAQTVFLASKSIVAVIGLVLGGVGGMAGGMQTAMAAGLAAFCAGAGLMLPDLWLSMAAGSRKEKVRNGMPDTLDLLVVSVEAGLGLDAALKRVGDEMAVVHQDLSDELRITTMESQMGLQRSEALKNMARRTGLEEVSSLVSIIVQAEKFGTSIAKALRNQADSLRVKRRQAAEERAQKTAVKLMIPLVLFIFPAMGVVLGGPAMIQFMRNWMGNPAVSG